MLLRHGQRAEQEAADRRAALADPGRWTAPIAAGTRWPDDPGVNVDVIGIDPSLPKVPAGDVRSRLEALRLAHGPEENEALEGPLAT